MNEKEKQISRARSEIYRISERSANRFNLILIMVLFLLAVLSELFNELGIFALPKMTTRVSMPMVCVVFLVPLCIRVVRDFWLKRPVSTLDKPWIRAVILITIFVGIGAICVIYTMHAVILLAIPPLVVAQYHRQSKLFWWGIAGTVLLVPISVYGGYFFGIADRNFFKNVADMAELSSLSARVAAATPHRMLELLLHYVIPRWFCVTIIMVMATGITRRNGRMLARQEELATEIQTSMERRNAMQTHVIEALAALIETRDEGTGEHVMRTKKYVSMIAGAMKNDEKFRDRRTEEEIDRIENAAPLHDIGKIAISDTILLKPGKLTPEEFDKMKTHTVKGERMSATLFAKMDDPQFLKTAEDNVIAHHEKWDGSGYPYGKKGEEIPLSARIMAVADVFDALVSFRVYKPSIQPEKALEIIYAESGTHFDPDIIRVVKGIEPEMLRVASAPVEMGQLQI